MLFALGSCGVSVPSSEKLSVVTTIFPPYDFAKAVAGDRVDLSVLVTVTDSHSFSPTAADMAQIEECDVFIYTGGDTDRWAEDFLERIDCADKILINMMELCALHQSEHHHEQGHKHSNSYDQHVWLDPHNAMSITAAICDALCKLDPQGKSFYAERTASYLAELEALDADFRTIVKSAKYDTIIVADQFPYLYLCEAYGLHYHSALSGCGSASDLAAIEYDRLASELANTEIAIVFCTEYSDRSVAQTVLRECGRDNIQILPLHSCHTLSRSAIEKGTTYLSLMRENMRVLSIALN